MSGRGEGEHPVWGRDGGVKEGEQVPTFSQSPAATPSTGSAPAKSRRPVPQHPGERVHSITTKVPQPPGERVHQQPNCLICLKNSNKTKGRNSALSGEERKGRNSALSGEERKASDSGAKDNSGCFHHGGDFRLYGKEALLISLR